MTDALAATKLVPPVLPDRHVVRPGLLRPLGAARIRVLLVSAPAGAGKTTLLAALGPGAAWLQLEAGDRDPVRFWTAVAHAVGRVRPGAAERLAPAARAGADALVPVLVNLLADGPELVLVLDDYHLVDDPEIHAGVDRLIDLLPPAVTLALSTRADPPLRLGRLRARGHLAEVRGPDLRFTPGDAAALLGADDLGDEQVALLCRRTEGWAAGLVLAGQSLRRAADPDTFARTFRGDDHLVADYLTSELLGPADTDRLLQTCVADKLTGPLVDHLTGGDDGAAWLARLAAADQLLLPLDASRTWYRHHQLVLDLLRARAADRLPGLHRRAAGWFQSRGEIETAVRHWIAAGDLPAAARVVGAGLGWQLIAAGESQTLGRLLDELGEAVEDVTGCVLQAGWCAFLRNDLTTARRRLDQARAVRAGLPAAAGPLFDALEMNIALGRGDVGAALTVAAPALAAGDLEEQLSPMSTVVGLTHAWAGRLTATREAMAVAGRRARRDGVVTNEVMALMYLALAEAEVGEKAVACVTATEAIDLAAARGLDGYHRVAVAHAVRAATTTDPAQAAADVRRALDLARRPLGVLDEAYVLAVAARQHPDRTAHLRRLLAACPDPGVLARHRARPAPMAGEKLTERELDVLRHLPGPLNQREIAAALHVSLNTVKTHSRGVFRKLRVTGRREAVRRARELGLLEISPG